MNVIFLIGMLVMMTVMGGPPQSTFLSRHAAQPGQDELEPAGGLEGTMGEVTVIAARDSKLADQEQSDAEKHCGQVRLHEKSRNCKGVESKEEDPTEI